MPLGVGAALLLGVVGAAVGSFLNVVIDRLPAGQSLVSPPSHCPLCQTRLRARDLAPVVSYLWLRGRCRYCGAPIPSRVLLVEVLAAASFVAIGLLRGASLESAHLFFYAGFLIVVIFIDLEHRLILNEVLVAAAPVALIVAGATAGGSGLVVALVAGAGGGGLFLAIYALARGAMGGGDVKLAAVIGLMTGLPGVVVALLGAILSGGATALVLLALRRKGRKDPIPFGPFLALGAALALLWGEELFQAYLKLLSWA
jgi:leader peptidase (prepilin peptidase)/N-methyltransferase